MNKNFKKLAASMAALSLAASAIVVPVSVSAEYNPLVEGDTVLNEWKFDFGAADAAPEDGFQLVTPDRNYVTARDYGFLGIDEESYKLGNRLDGFGNQEGQVIQLAAGGGTGAADGIGSVGTDSFNNAGEKYYPVRFALKVEDEQYFRIRATVTTLDPTKDANISLYTERKHPIFTEKEVKAGETYTADFTIRTTPIYYQKSNPSGAIADGLVNVCVLGENSALASLEIQQVETAPVFWVLGDSTVTDGNCALPFWPLQNYTGVGTGLTKYLPTGYAMVNEGEGGLNAADSLHFNMVKSRIKADDYLYVEYGHNHKDDGPTGYKACLDKYYDACHSVGAKLIIVSPIERINTFSDGAYQHSLDGFAAAGKEYVEEKLAAGADDIAYTELNQYSLDFYNKITADNGGDANAVKYYFQTGKGEGTDTTHPNDMGAENLAYEFMKAAKAVTDETQKAVLAPIVDQMKDETPNLVSADVMAGGLGGDAWPTYVPPVKDYYPVVIKDIDFNENGEAVYAKVDVQPAEIKLSTYGIIVITVKDADGSEKGKIYAINQVDNSTGYGSQEIENFTKDVTLAEGDTYSAVVLQADDTAEGLKVTEGGTQYSAVYTPTDIESHLILNEDGDANENFEYYGATYDGATSSLNEYNSWRQIGSAGISLLLNKTEDDTKYAEIKSDGAKNGSANQGSFYLDKALASEIGTKGRYVVSADMQFVSGGGLTYNLVTGHSDKVLGGTASLELFKVGNDGVVSAGGQEAGSVSATGFTNVKCILDLDYGTAEVTVGANNPVKVELENYQTTSTDVTPEKLTQFMFGGSKVAFDVKVANLVVAKLKDQKLPSYTLTAAANDDARGTVDIWAITPVPTQEPSPTAAAPTTDPESSPEAVLADNESAVITYENGKAKIEGISDKAVFAEVVYENGILKSVKTTEITDGSEVEAAQGAKLMLWDSLGGMKPLAAAVTAKTPEPTATPTTAPTDEPTPTPSPTPSPSPTPVPTGEKTTLDAELNAVVAAKAQANSGYVFMGWKDESGNLISEASEYVFRLRGDTTLIADFEKEPGVEEITSFSLSAQNLFIKAEEGASTTMVIVDPVDADGTPMNKVTNADIAWSCGETGVTVDKDGIVTLGADFSMGSDAAKDVTVTGTLNGISRSCNITFHSYDYTEDFSAPADAAWGFTGASGADASSGELTLLGKSSASAQVAVQKTLDTEISAASKVGIKFDWKSTIEANKGRHSNFVLMDTSSNPIFGLRGSGNAGLFYSTTLPTAADDTSFTSFSGFNQSWYTIDLVLDFTAKTINGTIKDTASGTVKAEIKDAPISNDAQNLGILYAVNTYSLAPMAIDNVCIKLY